MRFPLLLAYSTAITLLIAGWIAPISNLFGEEVGPNIVLIITDDQGYGPLGRHGNTWIRTPHLDSFHDRSVRFERFLVSPTCAPTRSAIMTGRHPEKNGVTHTIFERERMTLDAVTLPQILKTVGYQSAIFGKWHLGDEDEYQPNQRGFDESVIHGAGGIGQAYECSCADAPNNSYFNPIVRRNGTFEKTNGFCTDVFFDAAMRWIDQKIESKQPYFAYIATNAPHSPYVAPDRNRERFKKLGFGDKQAGFYGMIENIDENIGRLVQHLADLKQLDNTVLIFMSDNGTAVEGITKDPIGRSESGEELRAWNAGMKGTKNTPDEGGVRVPFFIRWDGHLQHNQSLKTVAAHIDILPTVAALCGAKLPTDGQIEGRSLLGLLPWHNGDNPHAKSKWEDRYLFTHVGRWPTGADIDSFQRKGYAIRSQRFRLVNGELYDMEQDPEQTTNVRDRFPQAARDMEAAFDQYWAEAKPLMVNENVPMSKTKPYWEAYQKQQASLP